MKWLFHHFWLKVASFVLALVVWIHVATEKTYNYGLNLPVTEITLKENLALAQKPPDSLEVSVSATGKQLLRRKWRHAGVRINASQYQAGRYSLPLSPANTSLAHQPSDMTLDEVIFPSSIQLDIDIESSTEVPVVPDLELSASEGFAISQTMVITPQEIELIGPRSRLGRVNSIHTEYKNLEGLRNEVVIHLALIPPEGYGFSTNPDSVTVTVPVVPVKTRVYEALPVVVFNAPAESGATARPGSIRAEITGPPTDIDLLNRNAITVSVDYRERNDSGWAKIQVDCPTKFEVKRTSADSVLIVEDGRAGSGN
jgi:YbbR domain-containing protein